MTTRVIYVHVIPLHNRVEHASFSEKESEAFMQLSRVIVEDFLPFIKKCFDTVFSESMVEQLALSTPYALRHYKNHKQETGTSTSPSSVSVLHGVKPSVDLRMELNVRSIGEVLKTVVPQVFDEIERQSSLATLNLDMESLLSNSANQPVLVGPQDADSNPVVTSHSDLTLAGTDATGSGEHSVGRTDRSQEHSDNFHHGTQVIDADSKTKLSLRQDQLGLQSGMTLSGTETKPIGESNSQREDVDSSALEIKTKATFPRKFLSGKEDKDVLTSGDTGAATSFPEKLRTSELISS